MAKKESSSKMSSLAARVVGGYQPTRDEIESLAASVMSQDETRGNREKPEVEPLELTEIAPEQEDGTQAGDTQ